MRRAIGMQQNELFENVKRIPRIAIKKYAGSMSGFCSYKIEDVNEVFHTFEFKKYKYF